MKKDTADFKNQKNSINTMEAAEESDAINTREYVSLLRQLVEEGHQVGMTIIGTSMEPFLKNKRDEIFFQKPQRELRTGDMVFYQRMDGKYVMHRICKKKDTSYYMAGDHQKVLEGPIAEKQIFALITEVRRNGTLLNEKSFIWQFYAIVWRKLRPMRLVLLRIKGVFRRIRRIRVKKHD